MKKTYRGLTTVCCLTLLAAPAVTVLGGETVPLKSEMEEMSLFMGADQLVETATRNPKPLSQVAENVTIITAEQIEAMNAHTLGEVLNRVPGIIMDGSYTDFGSSSSTHIQGSGYNHVVVLVDGVRWNYVSYDYPETNTIPVQIIKRIEVVKGPASSTWGSSFGGVVNIITKDTGSTARPTGTLSGTYGEWNTSDLRIDAAGQAGPLGYYLFAGRQESDGIRDTRFFDNQSFYGKFNLPLPRDIQLQATLGYSRPDYKYLYLAEFDDQGEANDRVFHATVDVSVPVRDNLTVNLSAYRFEDTLTDNWQFISTGEDYNRLEYEGKATGATGRLVWAGAMQTLVLGAETERRENTDKDLLAHYSAAATHEDIWAIYANDTIRFGDLTVTPGLRYDHFSIVDEELSPSLGLTYQLNESTLLRGDIARGFRKPFTSVVEGDPYFNILNPNLESETIWSYQVGVETTAMPFLHLKTTLFDHQASDVWVTDPDTWAIVNNGDVERQGLELAVQSVSFYNFSIGANGMYLKVKPDQGEDNDLSTVNLLLQYDDSRWRFQVFGHYLWFGKEELVGVSMFSNDERKVGTVLWDVVTGYRFTAPAGVKGEVFAALHNISDEEQYTTIYIPNAGRWVEAGLRFKF